MVEFIPEIFSSHLGGPRLVFTPQGALEQFTVPEWPVLVGSGCCPSHKTPYV